MGKYKIEATTFNSVIINPTIEIFLDGSIRFNQKIENNNVISTKTFSNVKEKLLVQLNEMFPNSTIVDIGFNIISRDLEYLKRQIVEPNAESLENAIVKLLISSICKELGIKNDLSVLAQNETKFMKICLDENIKTIKHKKLERVLHLFDEKKYHDAFPLLDEIDKGELSNYEAKEYDFIHFQLLVKRKSEDIEPQFKDIIEKYSDDPHQIKRLYFEYIRFLENMRDPIKPTKIIRKFEEAYPTSILLPGELAWYHYLKGRSEYGRGEYLSSLENLSLAMSNVDKNNERLIASILNTSVNSFTDNLFFNEARDISDQALIIRKKNDYSELYETISLQGGIEFKSTNYQKALDLFLEAEKQFEGKTQTKANPNRHFNYIAKSAIMIGDYNKAEAYLDKANKVGDPKGFSKSLELLLLLKKKNYGDMFDLYKTSIMLPENLKKYDSFAIAWSYSFMALALFEQKKYKDGVQYLVKAFDIFQDDMYILEAFYVSLFLYQYAVSEDEIRRFRDLTKDFYFQDDYEEYMEKHSFISERYSDVFGAQSDDCNLLRQFYDDTKNITDENYNSEIIKEILDSFCLI